MDYKIRDLLLKADKPARYCGGEFNTPEIKKDMPLKFLMCFPDIYEVAHSNLGIKILYYMLNNRPDTACETCFAPWVDMAELMKSEGMQLFSQENKSPINSFDIVGFSMQYEMSYTNVLYMLDMGKIELLSKDRLSHKLGEYPIIVAGGPCVINPEPLSDFIDIFSIGDGEQAINDLSDCYLKHKALGSSRAVFFADAAKIEGIYIPYIGKQDVRRAIIADLDGAFYPTKVQIPNIEAVHNRSVVELFRGCSRGCRFCQAGMIYRPVRERSVQTLSKYISDVIENNGFDEVSFSSLSTCDYPFLRQLLTEVKQVADAARVTIALPSTRVDSFEAEFVASTRLSSLTFAPEAGTQRLRDVINKGITEEDIFTSLKYAFSKGYSSVKLYFMIGLPTETDEDIEAIIKLCKDIRYTYKQHKTSLKPLNLSVSTSTFVPKPFTPFQWERQISLEEIKHKQEMLKGALKPIGIKYNWHDSKTSRIEATLARGDSSLGRVILAAYKLGAKFDGWSEFFNYEIYERAFSEVGVQMEQFTQEQPQNQVLPWEFVQCGVSREFLLSERKKAYEAALTSDCRKGCHNCGINKAYPKIFEVACKKCGCGGEQC